MLHKSRFTLPGAPSLDIGLLGSLGALETFVQAWHSKASEIPVCGAAGTKLREAEIRLRATAVLPAMTAVGPGGRTVTEIVSTVKHLAAPSRLGEASMYDAPLQEKAHVYLVPPDTACAVCGSAELELMPSSRRPATLQIRGLDGTRTGTGYKKVHRYNEIEVPAGKRLAGELEATPGPGEAEAPGAAPGAAPAAKRRCFRDSVLEQPYFRATQRTVYTKQFMDWADASLEACQSSFDGITRTARAVQRESGEFERVERRNLATAWFAREGIAACKEAGLEVPTADALGIAARSRRAGDTAQKATLRVITKGYRAHFRRLNLKGHTRRCPRPGRCRTAAVDGIHNLCTFKCRTQHRHYKLVGRWGQMALGCVNPPAPRSAYCSECLDNGGLRTPQADDPECVAARAAAAQATAKALNAAAGTAGRADDAPPVQDDAATALLPQDASTRFVRATTQAQRDAWHARFAPKAPAATPGPLAEPESSVPKVAAAATAAAAAAGASADGADGGAAADDDDDDGAEPVEDDEDEGEEAEDGEDVDDFAARYLEKGRGGYEPIKKDVYLVEEILGEKVGHLGQKLLLVKYVGWTRPEWEPRDNVSPIVLAKYDGGQPYGKAEYPSLLKDPTLEVLELTPLEHELYGDKDRCSTHKEEQKRWSKYRNPNMNGATGKSYVTSVLNTDAGQSVFVRCNLIGDLEPMYKHESIKGVIDQLWKISNDCPELFPPDDPGMTGEPTAEEKAAFAQRVLDDADLREQLVALFYDDGCHLLYSTVLRAFGRLAQERPRDSEAAIFYRRMCRLIICVDRMHFKGHMKTDSYCQENANPELFEDVLEGENSEAAEQTFRWMGLFGNMVRTMGQARAYFFLPRMCERRNRRILGDKVLTLNEHDLLALCAAYGLERQAGEALDGLRQRLTASLIAGERSYDLGRLDAHRARVAEAFARCHPHCTCGVQPCPQSKLKRCLVCADIAPVPCRKRRCRDEMAER